jgi:hypothetical protein
MCGFHAALSAAAEYSVLLLHHCVYRDTTSLV